MMLRVEELASAAGVAVDTVRFYRRKGLLAAPVREGRVAFYGEDHLERLQQIRNHQRQGFSLAQIRTVLERRADDGGADGLLAALLEERVGGRTLSRSELAAEAGMPEALIQATISAGLVEPLELNGEERFSEADLGMARVGLSLLSSGFPMQTLLGMAVEHAGNVQRICDGAIELFDEHVRKAGPAADDPEAISEAFRQLLPQVTRLVALHFQRTLVTRALNRLRGSGEHEALEAAVAATKEARLEVNVTWG